MSSRNSRPPIDRPRRLDDPVFSYADTALELRCSISSIRALVRKKKLTAIRLTARRVGIRQSEILRHLRDNEIGGTPTRSR